VGTRDEVRNLNLMDFKAFQGSEALETLADSVKRMAILIFHDDMLLSFILIHTYSTLWLMHV
jgi:hypothetical protein